MKMGVRLAAFTLSSLFLAGLAQAQDCSRANIVKRGTEYSIHLENACETTVNWGYNACVGAKSLESGTATVLPGQTYTAEFSYDLIGMPTLFDESCQGVCLTNLPSCPRLLKAAEALPKQETNGLLADKPATKPVQGLVLKEKPAVEEKPALKIKPATLPEGVGVKPVNTLPPEVTLPDVLEQKSAGAKYAVGPCVWTALGERNWLGASKVTFHNGCSGPVEVGARFCVAGKPDRQRVISIPHKGKAEELVSHPKTETPKYDFRFCQDQGCAPKLPADCEG